MIPHDVLTIGHKLLQIAHDVAVAVRLPVRTRSSHLFVTLNRCLALDRLEDDELRAPSELGIEIPLESEEALMLALKVRRRDRMQSVEELIEVLKPNGESEKPSVDVSEDQEPTPEQVEEVGIEEKKAAESQRVAAAEAAPLTWLLPPKCCSNEDAVAQILTPIELPHVPAERAAHSPTDA